MLQFLQLTQSDLPNCKVKAKQMLTVLTAFFLLSYPKTTRSLSRFTDFSLRTFFRILGMPDIQWEFLRVSLFSRLAYNREHTYAIILDGMVEGKSRHHTYGLDMFYSSTQKQPIKGIAVMGLSVLDKTDRQSYPIGIEQIVNSEEDKVRIAAEKALRKEKEKKNKTSAEPTGSKKGGRPKGSTNQPKEEPDNATYRAYKALLIRDLKLIREKNPEIKLGPVITDNGFAAPHYVDYNALQGLYSLSRLKSNGKITLKYEFKEGEIRTRRFKGDAVDTANPPAEFLRETKEEKDFKYKIYQFQGYSPNNFKSRVLNLVIVVATRISDGKISVNIFFTTDLTMDYETLLDYYCLRFQIEFDFRDAKSHFGFSDFKNYKKENVTNFMNLVFTAVLVGRLALNHYRVKLNIKDLGIIDLKLLAQGQHTAQKVIKLVRENPDSIFCTDFIADFKPDGLIHAA
jgi:putative transposase